MSSGPSLALRALMALGLMVGFYVLAVALAAGLLFIPYAELRWAHRIDGRIAIPCVIAAFAILVGIWPRRDVFVAPGPRLDASTQPRLFAELSGVAGRLGQKLPAEVYLAGDVNAGVGSRGGMLGMGGRTIMILGLPLMQVLTRSQFRAALGHEFGHEHGGDTRLGPWVYRTREAIGRTIRALAQQGSSVHRIFLAYGNMFLRITHGVSRQQELAADAYAARAFGAKPLADALRTIAGAGLAYPNYLDSQMAPALEEGFLPPLAEGFSRFVQAAPIAEAVAEAVQKRAAESDIYDTHPPLASRVAALAGLPAGEAIADDPPSVSLLDGVPELERSLLAAMTRSINVKKLKDVAWADLGAVVHVPRWERFLSESGKGMAPITPKDLPSAAQELLALGKTLTARKMSDEDRRGVASFVLGAALGLALVREGWSVEASPGEPTRVRLGEEVIEPFGVIRRLEKGELPCDDWLRRCEALGISDLALPPRPPQM